MKVLNLFEKHTQAPQGEAKGEVKELFPIGKADEWQWIEGVVDSGAVDSVAHPSMCPQYPGKQSEASKAGEGYTSASGDFLPNLGEQTLPVQTADGRDTCISYQLADVSKPLNSVSEICDSGGPDGQLVLFSKWGGTILNLDNWKKTPFERKGGIYTMGMWVRPPNDASVFTRQVAT